MDSFSGMNGTKGIVPVSGDIRAVGKKQKTGDRKRKAKNGLDRDKKRERNTSPPVSPGRGEGAAEGLEEENLLYGKKKKKRTIGNVHVII